MARDGLTIGDISERTGLAPSAIRHYESEGLVFPTRNAGGQRRYGRADIRRLSFVLIAQQLGFPLSEIRDAMAHLPQHRAPAKSDWSRISKRFGRALDQKIEQLTSLRDKLDGCIGCGCLSLESCHLYNPEDRAKVAGVGPRFVIAPDEV
jgi:MerR family redox-sensitive transcriptional activator SoxR